MPAPAVLGETLVDALVEARCRNLMGTRVPLFPGDRILAVGSSPLAASLAERFPKFSVFLVMPAAPGTQPASVSTARAPLDRLPFRNERFQFGASHLALAALPRQRRVAAFKELFRVLYFYGKAAVSCVGDPGPVREDLSRAGFAKIAVEKAGLDRSGPVHVVWAKRLQVED